MDQPSPLGSARRLRPPIAGLGIVRTVVGAVAAEPQLWVTAIRQLVLLTRPRWWRRWPPLPVPERAYLQFRLQTAYGIDGRAALQAAGLEARDVIGYLEWCRRIRALGG